MDELVIGELLERTTERVNSAFELLDLGAVRLSTSLVTLIVAFFAKTLAACAEVSARALDFGEAAFHA